MISLRELLAVPPEALPDLSRPNEDGGATPVYPEPNGWPIYRVRKSCPVHGLRRAWSWKPQYDDEQARPESCDTCLDRQDVARKDHERRMAEESRADQRRQPTGRTSRRTEDPLAA